MVRSDVTRAGLADQTGREAHESEGRSANRQVPARGRRCPPAGTNPAGRCRASSSSAGASSASPPAGPRRPAGRPAPTRSRGAPRGCAPARRRPGVTAAGRPAAAACAAPPDDCRSPGGNLERRARREDNGPLDQVLEFPHVARPVVALQGSHGGRRKRLDHLPIRRAKIWEKWRTSRDVLRPLAQRRHPEREHVEPVEEVASEIVPSATIRARSRLVAATRRTSTLNVLVPPSRSNSCSSSTRSSFDCRSERNLADLVQKQGPLVRQLEPADLLAIAPVNAPFSWPKSSLSSSPVGMAAQFSLTKAAPGAGSGRAWPGRPAPCRCRSPRDQHGGIRRGDHLDLAEHPRRAGLSPMISSKRRSVRISSSR